MENNIILITIDALRADRVSNSSITPNINRLSQDGILFMNCFSNGPCTRPSFPSFFLKNHHPYKEFSNFLAGDTVVQDLQSMGYNTFGFNAKNYYLSRAYNFDKGFDYFKDFFESDDKKPFYEQLLERLLMYKPTWKRFFEWYLLDMLFSKRQDISSSKSAEIFTDHIITKLESARTPFFIWTHYMDAHVPYIPPLEHTSLSPNIIIKLDKELREVIHRKRSISKEVLEQSEMLYDQEIKYLDLWLGRLFKYLEQEQDFDKLTIIITSDHGDEFNEHGKMSHPTELYDELIRVPLVIKGPDFPKKTVSLEFVETRDIPATIYYVASRKRPIEYSGEDIISIINNKKGHNYICSKAKHWGDQKSNGISPLKSIPYNRFSLRTREYKLIFDDYSKKYEFYNLLEDPEEKNNIIDKKDKNLEKYIKLQKSILKKYRSAIEKEKLRSLLNKNRKRWSDRI
jgi:arylsulfatase A-like enzyme